MLNYEQPAMIGRMLKFGGVPSLGSDCDPYFNSSMLWVMRHAFQHQRELDNRSLYAAGQWPAATQHSTQTRDALYWATMGGAKAMRLDRRIGSITPGKQADLAIFDTRGMNVFPAMPGGDPVHAVVMYAEAADVDSVMIAGRFVKRGRQTAVSRRQARDAARSAACFAPAAHAGRGLRLPTGAQRAAARPLCGVTTPARGDRWR
jgi:cytosine/adenosine deaminase-related metal-dependent hydrolase